MHLATRPFECRTWGPLDICPLLDLAWKDKNPPPPPSPPKKKKKKKKKKNTKVDLFSPAPRQMSKWSHMKKTRRETLEMVENPLWALNYQEKQL